MIKEETHAADLAMNMSFPKYQHVLPNPARKLFHFAPQQVVHTLSERMSSPNTSDSGNNTSIQHTVTQLYSNLPMALPL